MVKILSYIDRTFDKKRGFSRAENEENEKESKKSSNRIFAEDELDKLLNDGWAILSASTSEFVTGVLGTTTSFSKLTVILKK
jgi:hypothetical protein